MGNGKTGYLWILNKKCVGYSAELWGESLNVYVRGSVGGGCAAVRAWDINCPGTCKNEEGRYSRIEV